MSIQNLYDGAQLLCRTLRTLDDEARLSIQMGDTLEDYATILAAERPQQPLGLPFDPTHQDLSGGRAFWITGRNPAGELVHTQALRRLDLGSQNLADYLRHNFRTYPPAGVLIDFENSAYNPGPGARRMTGRVVYHGEIWIKDDPAYRGRGIVDYLSRLGLLTASMHWQPDYVFGLMARGNARRGLCERLGYMHSDPCAVTWKIEGRNQPIVGNLTWMAAEDIHFATNMPLEDVSAA